MRYTLRLWFKNSEYWEKPWIFPSENASLSTIIFHVEQDLNRSEAARHAISADLELDGKTVQTWNLKR